VFISVIDKESHDNSKYIDIIDRSIDIIRSTSLSNIMKYSLGKLSIELSIYLTMYLFNYLYVYLCIHLSIQLGETQEIYKKCLYICTLVDRVISNSTISYPDVYPIHCITSNTYSQYILTMKKLKILSILKYYIHTIINNIMSNKGDNLEVIHIELEENENIPFISNLYKFTVLLYNIYVLYASAIDEYNMYNLHTSLENFNELLELIKYINRCLTICLTIYLNDYLYIYLYHILMTPIYHNIYLYIYQTN
jgi:hypothetical protein